MILGEIAAGVLKARTNGDQDGKCCCYNNNGNFHQLIPQIQELLITTKVIYTLELRKEEHDALTKQSELKKRKQELLIQNQIFKTKDDFIKSLLLLKVYHSEVV